MPDHDMKFQCPACKRRYTWKPELAGKRLRCKCGEPVSVPAEMEIETPEDGPPDLGGEDFLQAVAETQSMPARPVARPAAAAARIQRTPPTLSAASKAAVTREKISDRWWAMVGLGVFVMVVAFFEFSRLSNMEQHGGTVYLTRLEYLMYMIAGRWGVLIFLVIVAGASIGFGIQKFLKGRSATER
ncbi:MAG TPA: hypothetical protein VFE47_14820 [Tepidisphaeraceae bacterium]|jgi:hypothetical protein|nr:hypothetical protein [Tepidisphaeraceae bacterium]